MQHPESRTVSVGEWSNFTCAIHCSQPYSLRWRFGLPANGVLDGPYIKGTIRNFRLFGERNGITVESVSKEVNSCRTQGGQITEVIRIMATSVTNGTVVQCAAIEVRGNQDYFSKFALMAVEPLQRESGTAHCPQHSVSPSSPPPTMILFSTLPKTNCSIFPTTDSQNSSIPSS